MKTLLTTLNAKYIHTSLALRLLYVAAKDSCDIHFKEYTIKDDVEAIATNILSYCPDIVGIGVYIWNVKQVQQLVQQLRCRAPHLMVIVGGPEVSYEPQFFIEHWPVDYVVSGEGEFVLPMLIQALEQGASTAEIAGVSSKAHISQEVAQANLAQLALLPSPYQLPQDQEGLPHRLVYIETSRGCPYQCQYCLSSLEKGVRYFPQSYITTNLQYLIQAGARQLKFLDRTFNLSASHANAIFDFLLAHYRPGLTCQFEVYADLLKTTDIARLNEVLPQGFFRFEIGVQSTSPEANLATGRRQDFEQLAQHVQQLMQGGKIILHLDLIAGLPGESYTRFVQSFNEVFALYPHELQLGFLKLLRGTGLRSHASQYGYRYQAEAPYEIISSNAMSHDDLQRLRQAEHVLDKYWNSGRFERTLGHLIQQEYQGRYYDFFDQFARYCHSQGMVLHRYLLEDLYRYLYAFLHTQGIASNYCGTLCMDYYDNFSQRPGGSWLMGCSKSERKALLQALLADKGYMRRHGLTHQIVHKQMALDKLPDGTILLTLFEHTAQGQLHRRHIAYQPPLQ